MIVAMLTLFLEGFLDYSIKSDFIEKGNLWKELISVGEDVYIANVLVQQ